MLTRRPRPGAIATPGCGVSGGAANPRSCTTSGASASFVGASAAAVALAKLAAAGSTRASLSVAMKRSISARRSPVASPGVTSGARARAIIQVGALEEEIYLLPRQRDPALLRRRKDILHGVSQRDTGIEIDDPSGAFQRMGGAHACLELLAGMGVTLEGEETCRERLRLALRLKPEEVLH